MSGKTTTQRDPAKLRSHQLQRKFFPMPADSQLIAMVETTADPPKPQILPEGTVITGGEWAYAMVVKDADSIDVIVRDDLAGNDAEVERLFIKDKLAHRDMPDLRIAWCLQRLAEIERGRSFGEDVPWQVKEAIRDELVNRDRKSSSPRQVNRLLQILRTPPEIQLAVEAGMIDIKLACKVESLPEDL